MSADLQDVPIAMDARMLEGRSGVATYARGLRDAQEAITSNRRLLEDAPSYGRGARIRRWLRAILPFGVVMDCRNERLLVAADVFRLSQIWFDVHRSLMPLDVAGPPGIMHWSHPMPLRIRGWINVYTVHDAIPLAAPHLSSIKSRRHRQLLDRIIAETRAVGKLVTVSAAARQQICAALNLSGDCIVNCGQAVERHDDPAIPLPAGITPGRYLLACGTVEARKNSLLLAEAYRRTGLSLPLVYAGPDGIGGKSISSLWSNLPNVIRIPDVDERQMTALIARARALVMPSMAEGFGLPVVEAMSLGVPVLASSIPAIEEVASNAALLVAPDDVAAITRGLCRIVEDERLRATLVSRGRANAQRFTPRVFANHLAALYANLIVGSR